MTDDELRVAVLDACCEAWRKAHEYCTDNEMYLSLVRYDGERNALIGAGLPPVKLCPWCGGEKATTPKERLARHERILEQRRKSDTGKP